MHNPDSMWKMISEIDNIKPGSSFIYCSECGNLEKLPVHYDIANIFLDEFFWICDICGAWREHPKSRVSNQGRSIYI